MRPRRTTTKDSSRIWTSAVCLTYRYVAIGANTWSKTTKNGSVVESCDINILGRLFFVCHSASGFENSGTYSIYSSVDLQTTNVFSHDLQHVLTTDHNDDDVVEFLRFGFE
eukprot:scaffold50592_cov46-Attheya_sp.AAC.3